VDSVQGHDDSPVLGDRRAAFESWLKRAGVSGERKRAKDRILDVSNLSLLQIMMLIDAETPVGPRTGERVEENHLAAVCMRGTFFSLMALWALSCVCKARFYLGRIACIAWIVCMYVCMSFLCMYVCMYILCDLLILFLYMDVWIYVCMDACMDACMDIVQEMHI
jgi:hypothetical protein